LKRTSKLLVMVGVVAATLAGPASPAGANTCTGISYDQNGPDQIGSWQCDPCPSPTHGPLDGRFHVIICTDPA